MSSLEESSLLHSLDEFIKLSDHAKTITSELEKFLNHIAKTGFIIFPWSKVKILFIFKLNQVLDEFNSENDMDKLPLHPNLDNATFRELKHDIIERLNSFVNAPFTIQRLCEMITYPRRHYQRTDKFLRGLTKCVMVVTTVDPDGNKIHTENTNSTLTNGFNDNSNGDEEEKKLTSMTSPSSSFSMSPSSSWNNNSSTNEFKDAQFIRPTTGSWNSRFPMNQNDLSPLKRKSVDENDDDSVEPATKIQICSREDCYSTSPLVTEMATTTLCTTAEQECAATSYPLDVNFLVNTQQDQQRVINDEDSQSSSSTTSSIDSQNNKITDYDDNGANENVQQQISSMNDENIEIATPVTSSKEESSLVDDNETENYNSNSTSTSMMIDTDSNEVSSSKNSKESFDIDEEQENNDEESIDTNEIPHDLQHETTKHESIEQEQHIVSSSCATITECDS
ncbi:unnamed protein product [Didymodactylos carnosus]|nr:unnamed protein product [Didymodactylos carnosus]CAF3772285.1 unnamed protein product [Didymodactylos carnosus]